MIIFLLLNLSVIITAFLLVNRVLRIKSLVDSLVSIFILYFSQIVIMEILLGILGILFLRNLLMLNLAILLGVWLTTRTYRSENLSLDGINKDFLELFNSKTTLFITSVILVFSLVKLLINLVNPPFGWDSLNYHFVFPVEWLKQGNLNTPITVFDDPSPSYYPINGSLFYLWLIFPIKNVSLADLGQLPFFILSFLATYSISRKIGINRKFSFYSASLFLLIPNFFKQLSVAYVDVMVTGLFLTCIVYLFLLTIEFSLRYVLLYSMSLGLLIGTKTVAFPYSILLIIPFMLILFRNRKNAYLLLIALLITGILGGFSYIRNFFETGNPLYPLEFKLFGDTIFRGVMDMTTYRAHFKPEDYRLSKLLFHEGLGLQSLLFILPATFLALPLALWKRKTKREIIYFSILPVLIYLIYRYIIPLANTRYLYPLFGTGIICAFFVIERLKIHKTIIDILVFLCALISMSELAKRQELVISIILTVVVFFLAPFFMKLGRQKKSSITPASLCLIFGFILLGMLFLEKDYFKNEFPRYKKMVKYSGFWPDAAAAWEWLNNNTTCNNIAYIGRPVPFPLYGTNFKNNVYYVSVNKTEPAKLHYFLNSRYQWGYDFLSLHKNLEAEGNYRAEADYVVWLSNLFKRNADYLFIYSLHQTKEREFPLEDTWAREHPDKFIPVFSNETVRIYRIVK